MHRKSQVGNIMAHLEVKRPLVLVVRYMLCFAQKYPH